jgi:hypothetical protein
MSTYETVEQPEAAKASQSFVRIDPRVVAELERKRPIGVSLTGWVSLLLQRAIALEPEALPRD